jgi:acyl transferase domain-containing protein
MAFKALQNGEIEAAIVGGANLIMNPRSELSHHQKSKSIKRLTQDPVTSALHSQGVLSPNGTCKTFSADVDGYARGEALNVLYIKRLPDAVKKENPIRAVIRSTATNSDGKTAGIAQPGSNTQEALIRTCYAAAGINDVGNTAFVECHGTGTPIGDPLEAAAVASVFGDRGIYIGSVKVNAVLSPYINGSLILIA